MTRLSYCGAGCRHGGLCDLEPGHAGLHSSGGYCTFTDAEAITRAESDAICSQTPLGAVIVPLQAALEAMTGD